MTSVARRNVALLSAGPPPPDPAELLTHERLRLALESLAGASDLVVIDAPPVLPVADPIILAQLADVTLLVATAGLSDRREWSETLERLRKVDARLVGTVLLQPDSRVHATPSYRYAPTAAPAHWWVTEASRRSDASAAPSSSNGNDATEAMDTTTADPGVAVEAASDEPAAKDAYPWRAAVAPDELVWQHTDAGKPDDLAGSDVAASDDDVEPVTDRDPHAG